MSSGSRFFLHRTILVAATRPVAETRLGRPRTVGVILSRPEGGEGSSGDCEVRLVGMGMTVYRREQNLNHRVHGEHGERLGADRRKDEQEAGKAGSLELGWWGADGRANSIELPVMTFLRFVVVKGWVQLFHKQLIGFPISPWCGGGGRRWLWW